MHIPAFDTEESRRSIAAEEQVLAALSGDAQCCYYLPLGVCSMCGGNDAVNFVVNALHDDVWCAEKQAFSVDSHVTFPLLLNFLRRVGVDVGSLPAR